MKEFEKIAHYKNIGGDMFEACEVGDLVRCKDCKYNKSHTDMFGKTDSWCEVWSDKYHHSEGNDPVEPNDYCSYGERREDERS